MSNLQLKLLRFGTTILVFLYLILTLTIYTNLPCRMPSLPLPRTTVSKVGVCRNVVCMQKFVFLCLLCLFAFFLYIALYLFYLRQTESERMFDGRKFARIHSHKYFLLFVFLCLLCLFAFFFTYYCFVFVLSQAHRK